MPITLYFGTKETYLIEECVSKNYTLNSCEKVFCQPWQRYVDGFCSCKLPYQCPRNGTSVCSTDRKTFQNYCQLRSLACQHVRHRFMNRGRCNPEASFHIFLESESATSEGIVQVEVNHSPKISICGNGWGMNEANVVCRHLGFPEGADRTEVVDPEDASHSLECLRAKCRGIETSLAECTLERLNRSNEKVAKVLCHTEHKECSLREFRCVNRKCIPFSKTCNGINDCGDLSDEVCCRACKGISFHCDSDVCIPNSYLCNNEMDCLTGEDESRQLCNKGAKENKREGTGEAEESMDEGGSSKDILDCSNLLNGSSLFPRSSSTSWGRVTHFCRRVLGHKFLSPSAGRLVLFDAFVVEIIRVVSEDGTSMGKLEATRGRCTELATGKRGYGQAIFWKCL
ncbi:complement factor I isoform X2 [Rhineura floridana]|uniref:complement factor I isoform X2 n=1 Tax=Rhineura floridana TaxID=261503 RepID=UPI002AC81605|nr:complement factor I isoform X2 [Rhineura floridana]